MSEVREQEADGAAFSVQRRGEIFEWRRGLGKCWQLRVHAADLRVPLEIEVRRRGPSFLRTSKPHPYEPQIQGENCLMLGDDDPRIGTPAFGAIGWRIDDLEFGG